MITSTVPSQPRPFLATLNVFRTTPDNQRDHPSLLNYPGPVEAYQTTPEDQDLLYDHPHCFKPTTTFPGYSKRIPDHSRRPTRSPITPELPWTSQSLPNHSRPNRITKETQKLFQAHTDLSYSHSITFQVTPDHQRSFQIHPEPLSIPDHSILAKNTIGLPTQAHSPKPTNSYQCLSLQLYIKREYYVNT